MDKIEEEKLLAHSLKVYGLFSQLDQLIEECAELIQAVNKVNGTERTA